MANSPDLVQYFTRPIYNPHQYHLMDWRKLLIGKWSWKRPFYTFFWCYALLTFYGYFMADNIIFQPPGTPYPKNRTGFSSIGTGDKAVAIFHLKPGPKMPTILWSHGNAQNLKSLKPALESFHIRGFGVISYDYPGYGESGGKPTEKGLAMTEGGPGRSTILMTQSIIIQGLSSSRIGLASAMSFLFFLVIAVVTFTQVTLMSRQEPED